jgi:heptosyltransferase-2
VHREESAEHGLRFALMQQDRMFEGPGAERLAQIFLKPRVGRHRWLLFLAEAVMRPLVFFSGRTSAAELLPVKRILVCDSGLLGDAVLLAPFLRGLRNRYPDSHIALLGRAVSGALLMDQNLIDERLPVELPWDQRLSFWKRHNPFSLLWTKFFREVWRLRQRRFDLAVATGWGSDLRENLVIWLSGARRRVGYGYAGGDFFLTDVVPADLTRPHVVDRNLRLLEHIGMWVERGGESLAVNADAERTVADLLAHHGVGNEDLVIGINPGAGSAIREWGDERFADVGRWAAERFNARILWFTDPTKPKPVPANVDAIRLGLPLGQMMAALSRCQLFICNDSGPMHVAAALKVPVVAVFGPQRPEWFGPYGEGHQVVIRHEMWCRPCADQCRWKEPYCLRLISVEQVMEAVRAKLECPESTAWRSPVEAWVRKPQAAD